MSGADLRHVLLDTVLAGLLALVVFGPIVGVVLDGYGFTLEPARLAVLVGAVMLGRLLLGLFLHTASGRRWLQRFDGGGAGVQGIDEHQHQGGLLRMIALETVAQVVGQVRVEQGVGHQPQDVVTEMLDIGSGGHGRGRSDIGQDPRVVFTEQGGRLRPGHGIFIQLRLSLLNF